jgi:hypothetical protein
MPADPRLRVQSLIVIHVLGRVCSVKSTTPPLLLYSPIKVVKEDAYILYLMIKVEKWRVDI